MGKEGGVRVGEKKIWIPRKAGSTKRGRDQGICICSDPMSNKEREKVGRGGDLYERCLEPLGRLDRHLYIR